MPPSRSTTRWSIRILPLVFELFGAQLREAQITHDKLEALSAGHDGMDDGNTRQHVDQVFAEQRALLPFQLEQIRQWQSEATTQTQREALAHLTARAERLSALYAQIFALLGKLS
jgi:Zn-dependent M32 family carboxypeptidase